MKGIALIASIFNAILHLEYYSKAWKISLITLIPKPNIWNQYNQYMKLAPIAQLVFYLLCQNYSRRC